MSPPGRYCCKSLFALVIENSPGRTRDFRVKMWETSSPKNTTHFGANMITLEDCIGFCGLTEEVVLAIAEHEHLPEIAATALAQYLLSHERGSEKVRDMIV